MPDRDLIVFVTFVVILVTLVGQVLTLPVLIARPARLEDDGGADREDAKARIKAAEAALARLEELAVEDWVREDTAERMRGAVPLPHATGSAPATTGSTTTGSRGAVGALPAAAPRAARRRAQRGARAAQRGR